ncbi:MAG: UDP-N-acetylmuramate dehydrogenase [Pseudomonadota bacterium]
MRDGFDIPLVRGRMEMARPLAPLTWLRVGGPAECLFQPADADDLAGFLGELPRDVPVTPLGVCSNLIIRDGGLPGVAIKLGRAFMTVEILEEHRVRAGAGVLDAHVARRAADAGIAGLEYLRTIPGAIGGAVRMNAGCYGTYTADVVETVEAVTRDGATVVLKPDMIGFGYRRTAIPEDMVITAAVLRGRPGDPAEIHARMDLAMKSRAESQPVRERSCGSTFANPAGYSSTGAADDPMDLKAWKLIDDAGCRGLRLGGAQMSEMHANFMINTGNATAADLEGLGEEVRARVKSYSGHDLTWEIQRIGVNVTSP